MEGRGHGLIWYAIPELFLRDWGKPWTFLVGVIGVPAGIITGTFGIQVRNVTAWATLLGKRVFCYIALCTFRSAADVWAYILSSDTSYLLSPFVRARGHHLAIRPPDATSYSHPIDRSVHLYALYCIYWCRSLLLSEMQPQNSEHQCR